MKRRQKRKFRCLPLLMLLLVLCFTTGCTENEILLVKETTAVIIKTSKSVAENINTDEIVSSAKNVLNDVVQIVGAASEAYEDYSNSDSSLEKVQLLRVVDGDTIVVNGSAGEMKVRLIGIDAPESVHVDASKNNEYGDLASAYTKELLKNTETVYLEYDVDKKDQYDRFLAYVWITEEMENPEENMVNAIIVREGYAINKEYPPNIKYKELFHNLYERTKEAQKGLWANGFSME